MSYEIHRGSKKNTSSLVILAFVQGGIELLFSKIKKTGEGLVFWGGGCRD